MTREAIADERDGQIARLRGGFNDLTGLIALSAAWADRDLPEIARMLADALVEMLQLDVALVELDRQSPGAEPVTVLATGRGEIDGRAIARELSSLYGPAVAGWPDAAAPVHQGTTCSLARLDLSLPGQAGAIAAVSARPGFPDDVETLLLNIARNQALLAMQEARRRDEERRQAEELSATTLIEGIPGLVAILGPDGRVERVNRRIEDYCGQTLEELRQWGTNGTVHPEDMPHVAVVFGASIASGADYDIEQRLRRHDGAYRWFRNQGNPLRDETGAVVAWHVLLTDIDDRKRAEDSVRASERELRQQVETFPQMLWSATAEGNIDHCNERLLEFSGLTDDDVMNGGWVNLLHPDDREPTARIWMHCIATGDPYTVEVRQFHVADATWRWVLTMALPLRDGEGRIVKWYGSCVDIHDLKQTEEALRASERQLAQTIDTIPAYVFSAAPDGSVNYLNPQIRHWFGRDEERILASEWVHLVHPDDRDGTVEAWLGAVAAGTPYQRELRFMHRDGAYRRCDCLARPLRGADGAIIAWHGVVNDIEDRKLAEDALKASERNLRLTIDTIPALAWSAKADGTADFFSRQYLDYVGRAGESLRDWQWVDLVHPDDLPTIAGTWDDCRQSGTGAEVEARLRRHDGTYRWFRFQTNPLRDESGDVVKWYGVNTDIEDAKRATLMLAGERELLELIASGQALRDVLESLCSLVEAAAGAGVCEVRTLDETGTAFQHVVAPSLPEGILAGIAGRPLSADASPSDLAVVGKVQVVVEDVATDARWRDTPARARMMDHQVVSAWVAPVVARDGRVVGSLGIYHRDRAVPQPADQDVIDRMTQIASIAIERWRAEDELKRREYLLQTAEQISESGWFYWNLNTNKLVWSPQMYRIWEVDEDVEPLSVNLLPRVHPDDRPSVEKRIEMIFNGEDIPPTEERYLMPDGRMKYVSGSTIIFRYEDGRRECVGVAQDITRRRVAENALDKVRSELAHVTRVTSLGELTASIAHEVNQPLAGIITNASTCLRLLSADTPDIEGAIKTAQRTLRDGDRASQVIQRLRGLFRKQDFLAERLDLNEAAREVVAICAHDMERRRIVLEVDLHPGLPPVFGDRTQLQQVILNLVLNAADAIESAAGKQRQILVATAPTDAGTVQLTVRDTGGGISDEDMGKVFEAFYTTKPKGMGIGLSVSRTILERHGGTLWVAANEGVGATFGFTLDQESGRHAPDAAAADP